MPPCHNRPPRRSGFTLIEVVAAVAILSIGIAVILRYFLYVEASVNVMDTETEAGEFLGSAMDNLTVELLSNRTLRPEGGSGEVRINRRPARWEWSYAEVEPPEGMVWKPPLQEVVVSVSWRQDGRARDMRLHRYVTMKEGGG